MPTMEALLREATEKGASDLHLSSGEPPMLRVHGDLVRMEHPALTPESVTGLVNSIMNDRQRSQFSNEHEVGPHTGSFTNALRSALREDPDVILIGEMRDLETISLALTAAETGHLVFGTLHTSSAPKTIDRIIDVFPGGQQAQIRTMLSESLEAVVAQTLVKKKGGGGRVAACEILIGVPAVRNLIREGKLHQIPSMMQTGQRVGMQTLDMALADLVKRGMIEPTALPPRPTINGTGTGAAHGAAAAPA